VHAKGKQKKVWRPTEKRGVADFLREKSPGLDLPIHKKAKSETRRGRKKKEFPTAPNRGFRERTPYSSRRRWKRGEGFAGTGGGVMKVRCEVYRTKNQENDLRI